MSSENKYKILTICSWYPNKLKPTLGNFVQKHAEVIATQNETIALAIFPDEKLKEHEITDTQKGSLREIIVYYPKKSKGFKLFRLAQNFFSHRKAFKIAYKRVLEHYGKPDLVHLNIVYPLGIWAVWLKWRYKIPFVITENSSGFHVTSEHAYPKHILMLCKIILRNAYYILPVSDNLKKNLQRLSPKGNYDIICNVVDEKLFTKNANSTFDQKRLIHISTGVDEIKNVSGMVRVMRELKNRQIAVALDIVSDGDIAYAKRLSEELDLNDTVFFHSTKTTAEIANMIEERDALLMFSNYENFPCVIAESMMCGKPIIATSVNGIPEHVTSFNGVLVEARDEHALMLAISDFVFGKLSFDASEIRQYAEENFGYQSVGLKFLEVYRKVLHP